MAAGSIVIDLLMKTGSFVTDTGRAEKSLKSFQKTTVDVTGTLQSMLPLLSAGAITAWGKSVIDASDALNDLSIRTGVAVKDLASLELIAKQSDTSIESLGQGLNKLSKSIGQAEGGNKEISKALAELGINTKDPIEGFLQLADAVTKSTDRTKLNANLSQVLGKSYQEFYVILSEGRTQLEASVKASEAYANQQAKFAPQAAKFNDQLDMMKQRFSQTSIEMINNSGLLDSLSKMMEYAAQNIDKITVAAKTAFEAIALIYSVKTLVGLADLVKSVNLVKVSLTLATIAAVAFYNEFTGKNQTDAGRIRLLSNEIIKLNEVLASGARQVRTDKGLQNIKLTDAEIQTIIGQRNKLVNEITAIQNKMNPPAELPTPTPTGGITPPKDTTVPTNPWSETTKDLAAFIQKVQDAVQPNKALTVSLQEQLDTFYNLDPALRKYIQGQIDAVKANEAGAKVIEEVTARQKRLKELLGKTQAGTANEQIKQAEKDVKILNEALDAGQISLKEYLQANDNLFGKTNDKINETKSFMKDLGAVFSSAFEQAVIDGQKFSGVLAGLANDIQRLITRRFITDPLMKGVDTIIGNAADKFGGWIGGTLFSAHGNVFDQSGVKAFATGGVVSGATPFSYGGGSLGVMGEAGPEAILPLSRIGGDLGVKAQIGTPVINVNIHEAAGTRTNIEKSTDASGNISIDVIVEQVENIMGRNIYRGSGIAPTIERRYGLNRAAGV